MPASYMAVLVAALVLTLAPTTHEPRRWRRVLPRVGAADLLVAGSSLLTVFVVRRWAFPGSDHAALRSLVPSVDNVAHFHMFATIRVFGARTGALGASPDGSPWSFNEYPQGFHSLAATVAELMHPDVRSGPALLSTYTEAMAVVVVLAMTVLVAAIVSLPRLRDRPLLALPVVALTGAAFLWVPGQIVLADGFANFWVACAAAAASLLLAVSARRAPATAQVAAVAGLQVAVAWAWAPLLALSAPALLALFVPLRRPVWPGRHRALPTLLVLAAAGLLVGWAVLDLLRNVGVSSLVTATGGIHGVSVVPTMILAILGLGTLPRATRLLPSPDDLVLSRRLRVVSLSVVAGVLLTIVLLVAQVASLGESSYYLLKFTMGVELVLAGVVPAGCAAMLAARTSLGSTTPKWSAALVVLAAVVLSQAFGTTIGAAAPLTDESRAGTATLSPPYSSARLSDGVMQALHTSGPKKGFDQDYLAIGREGASYAFYADAWFHAISTTSSLDVSSRMDLLRMRVDDVHAAVAPVRRLLSQDPRLRIVVSPAHLAELRAALDDPELSARVVSY